jgi:TP901 family phage tail tape measure protein
MTEAVLNLSRATGTDATMSAGIMAATIRQFGLAAEDAARVSDSLTAAANKSFNTVEALGEAMTYAGPVAADFNMSLEDTLAVLGALGNVGIQGSNAGTAVRRLLTLGAAEADKLNEIFGVAFQDAAGNARPLVDVLDEVNEATKNLGTAERAKKFNDAFGLLGITGASAISKNAVSVRELQKAIKEAGGIADETAKKMDAGLGGAFRILMSAIEGVQLEIGKALSPAITDISKRFTELAGSMNKLIQNNQKLVVGIAFGIVAVIGIGAALIAVGLAAQGAAMLIGGVLLAVKALALTVALVSSPLGAIGLALVAGVAAWALWTESGQKAVGAVSDLFGNLKETFGQTWGGIVNALKAGDLALASEIAMAGLEVAWQESLQAMGNLWHSWSKGVVKTFTATMRNVLNLWKSATDRIANWLVKDKAARSDAAQKSANVDLISGAVSRMDRAQKVLDNLRAGQNMTRAEALEFVGEEEARKFNRGTTGLTDAEIDARQQEQVANLEKYIQDQRDQIAAITGEEAFSQIGKNAISDRLDGIAKPLENFFDAMDESATTVRKERPELTAAKANLEQLNDDAFWGDVAAGMEAAGKKEAADKASEVDAAGKKEAADKASEVDAAVNGGIQAMKSGAGGSSFGSFSASALMAGGGRGGVAQQQLMVAKEQVKLEKAMLKIDEAMIKAIEKKSIQVID